MKHTWKLWFAWYPVKTVSGKLVWLATVERLWDPEINSWGDASGHAGSDGGHVYRSALTADERVNAAFNEWQSKTEWVQETAKPKELGVHRADVLKQRIDELQAAARLALDALNESINVPCYGGHPKQEAAAAALKEVL